jgi:hypothetical protein
MENSRNVLLAPLQIPLHLLRILEALLHARSRLCKPSLCLCAQLFDLALLVVEFSGSGTLLAL